MLRRNGRPIHVLVLAQDRGTGHLLRKILPESHFRVTVRSLHEELDLSARRDPADLVVFDIGREHEGALASCLQHGLATRRIGVPILLLAPATTITRLQATMRLSQESWLSMPVAEEVLRERVHSLIAPESILNNWLQARAEESPVPYRDQRSEPKPYRRADTPLPVRFSPKPTEHAQQRVQLDPTVRFFVHESREPALVLDRDGLIQELNRPAEDLLGRPRSLVLGQPLEDSFPRTAWRSYRGHLPVLPVDGPIWWHEVRIERRDGSQVVTDFVVQPVNGSQGQHLLLIARNDRTLRLPDTVDSACMDKEQAANLVSRLCHDYNNVHGIILNASEYLLERLQQDEVAQTLLKEAHVAVERAVALTKQLREAFPKPEPADRIELNATVRELVSWLGPAHGGPGFELNLKAAPGVIRTEPRRLKQGLLALLEYGSRVVALGHRLIIETHDVELDTIDSRAFPAVEPGKFLRLNLRTESDLAEEPGQVPMELAKVYGLVNTLGGFVQLSGNTSANSLISVYFPAQPTRRQPSRRDDAGARILLIESAGVKELARHILEREGHVVLFADNCEQAWDICQNSTHHIDLLITDPALLTNKSRAFLKQLQELHPDVGILYLSSSGDPSPVSMDEAQQLTKPFHPECLVQAVRGILSRLSHASSSQPSAIFR